MQMLMLEKLPSQFIERNVQRAFDLFQNTAFLREKLELNISKKYKGFVFAHFCKWGFSLDLVNFHSWPRNFCVLPVC